MREIKKAGALDADIYVPGSKSYTQRALVIAALADGISHLRNCLCSDDTNLLVEALRELGVDVRTFGKDTIVQGTGGNFRTPAAPLFMGNNGTGTRFLAALTSLGLGPVVIDGDARLRERPVKSLIDALNAVGGNCKSAAGDVYPPVVNYGGGLRGGVVRFKDSESSQHISSVLIVAPYAQEDIVIELEGRVLSKPYIDMTLEVMDDFGVPVTVEGHGRYRVPARSKYRAREYFVEGDASSASYFFLAAGICGGRVCVKNLDSRSRQGDLRVLDVIEELGCMVKRDGVGIEVVGRPLKSGERRYDCSEMPDMVPGLAVFSAFRKGRTIIHNVPHLRIKESDRLAATVEGLKRIGIDAWEIEDGIVIDGGEPVGGEIETYSDHRIAMSFAVAGLRTGGIKIAGESCVAKSFPEFWAVLEELAR